MKIRTFWIIFIKILGLGLVIESFRVVPNFFSSIIFTNSEESIQTMLMWVGILLVTFVFYFVILKVFLFNSNWIVDILQLDKNFTEEQIELNFNSDMILRISTVIIGGFVLVESLPAFCKELFLFYQRQSIFRVYSSSGWLIFYFIKSLIGYLLMTNSKSIIDFINNQTKDQETK